MNITCIIPTLGGGGAERVMLQLCAGLVGRGHRITLLTLYDAPDFYTVPPGVERVQAHADPQAQGMWARLKRVWLWRRAIKRTRPDVVISFMALGVLAAAWLLRVPYIFAEHLDVSKVRLSRRWLKWRLFLLNRAARVVVLSWRDKAYIERHYPRWKTSVIYNPAFAPQQRQLARPPYFTAPHTVLAVGRLTRQKGFERLLEAWQLIQPRFANWRLCIVGGGEEKENLISLAETLDVQGSVSFVPPQKDLCAAYQYADLLVMSSRFEGFPLVLLEAMAAGVPAVSFVCNGPDVIIRDGTDGFLVPQGNTDLLAEKMAQLMQDEPLRQAFGTRAREVCGRFSPEHFVQEYEQLCLAARK